MTEREDRGRGPGREAWYRRLRFCSEIVPLLPVAVGMTLAVVAVGLPFVGRHGLLASVATALALLPVYALGNRPTRHRLLIGVVVGGVLAAIHIWSPWQTYLGELRRPSGGRITAVITDPFADPGPWASSHRYRRVTARLRSMHLTGSSRHRCHRGKIQLVIPVGQCPGYGTKVEARGIFESPPQGSVPGAFNYRQYLFSRGIRHQFLVEEIRVAGPAAGIRAVVGRLFRLRDRLAESLVSGFRDEANAKAAAAMTLGYRGALDAATRRQFLRSGALHIFAISGLHVGITMQVAVIVLKAVGVSYRRRHVLLPILLGVYVVLTGGTPSAVRAWVMISAFSLSSALLRPRSPLNSISLALIAMLLANPLALFNVGCQFSFVIVTAIVLSWDLSVQAGRTSCAHLYWVPQRRSKLRNVLRYIRRKSGAAISCATAAWLASAGLVAWHNCLFIPAALWLNMVVAVLAFAALCVAVVKASVAIVGLSFAGMTLAVPLEMILATLHALVEVAAEGEGCIGISRPPLFAVLAYYLSLAVALAPRICCRLRVSAAAAMALLLLGLWWPGPREGDRPVVFVHGNGQENIASIVRQRGMQPLVVFSGDYLVDRATVDILRVGGHDEIEVALFPKTGQWAGRSMVATLDEISVIRALMPSEMIEMARAHCKDRHSPCPRLTTTESVTVQQPRDTQVASGMTIDRLSAGGITFRVPATALSPAKRVELVREKTGYIEVISETDGGPPVRAVLPASREIQVTIPQASRPDTK